MCKKSFIMHASVCSNVIGILCDVCACELFLLRDKCFLEMRRCAVCTRWIVLH